VEDGRGKDFNAEDAKIAQRCREYIERERGRMRRHPSVGFADSSPRGAGRGKRVKSRSHGLPRMVKLWFPK